LRTLLLALLALALPLAAAARPTPERRLSDRDLRRYAAARFDKRALMFRRIVLGRHHGTLVVADHPCGDVCPQYTRRIVHYDVPPELCAGAGGIVEEVMVPSGIAVTRKRFCVPRVLAKAVPPS
jgi:hypothetical protein